ncbi:hypothetical protein TKK_0008955 [Trichogramma kaykai]
MAVMCPGPPPLPPGKKFLQRATRKLSTGPTYRSFRDPSLEAWIPPEQRLCTPQDDDDIDDIDGFDFSSVKLIKEEQIRNGKISARPASKTNQRRSVYFSASASSSPVPARNGPTIRRSPVRGSASRVNLFRSRSEGNLMPATGASCDSEKKQSQLGLTNLLTTPLRAVYGSWRNLLQRKCRQLKFITIQMLLIG